jgi:DNA-binding CsgD family transcriptional regulator
MTKGPVIPISERNRQILQLRKEGMSQTELARRFKWSPSRL